MKAFMHALKQSYEVYYPEKEPYGHIVDKPLPFPQGTTELIRWTMTFIDQIAYKYSKEVEEVKECNGDLERRIIELEHELEHVVCEKERLCQENDCLREENEGLCIRVDKLQDEVRTLYLKISSLKTSIAGLEKEKLSLLKKIEVLQKELEIHQKELSIVSGQLATCQTNLGDSQAMWLLAVKEQQRLELEVREKMQLLAKAEAERDGLDSKMKLVERELELALERVEIGKGAVAEWEGRFEAKTAEVAKLLEMWASMDKECKISIHGKGHWDMHHGFPKGLPHHKYRIPEVQCPDCDKEITVPPLLPPEDPLKKRKGKEPDPPPRMPDKVPVSPENGGTKKENGRSIPVPSGKKSNPKT